MGYTLPPRPCREGDARSEHRRGSVDPSRRTSRSSRRCQPPPARRQTAEALVELHPLQGLTTRARRAAARTLARTTRACTVPSRSSFPLDARGTRSPRSIRRACRARLRSVSRVSHPPDGLLLHAPPGLVSSRWRPRGSLFGALLPRDELRRLSTPHALLTFTAEPRPRARCDASTPPAMACGTSSSCAPPGCPSARLQGLDPVCEPWSLVRGV